MLHEQEGSSNNWWLSQSVITLEWPSTMSVVGSTSTGKTNFTLRLIRNVEGMFNYSPKQVIYCYGKWQDGFEEFETNNKNVIFHNGLPSSEYLSKCKDSLIILDDLMLQIINDKASLNLVVQGSHHDNNTIIFILQNLYPGGKYGRSQALNTQIYCLFRNYRDVRQIKCFAGQVVPSDIPYFMSSYEKATARSPFSYLICDIHPKSNKKYFLRSNIFPGEDMIIFEPCKQ